MFVERFVAWSVAAGSSQRSRAIADLAADYVADAIDASDRKAAEQVFTLYLDDPSSSVRAAMAQAFAPHAEAPRKIIWALANDIAEIAAIVFLESPLLRRTDLAHALQTCDAPVLEAIAKRPDLDADLARTIVGRGPAVSVLALLDNDKIVLSPALKHEIAVRLGEDARIRHALLEDDMLLPQTRQCLTGYAAGAILSLVESKGWGPTDRLQRSVQDAGARAVIGIAERCGPEHVADYVSHLYQAGQLTPAVLVRAACTGNAAFLEAAMATLSGATLKKVQSIIDSDRATPLKALYSKTGLPQSVFPVIAASFAVWREAEDASEAMSAIIERVEEDERVDGSVFALIGRIALECDREAARNYERQPLLTAA